MIVVIMITIILFFQLCHKPKQLREILRQAVKTQTQLGSLIFNRGSFYPETNSKLLRREKQSALGHWEATAQPITWRVTNATFRMS